MESHFILTIKPDEISQFAQTSFSRLIFLKAQDSLNNTGPQNKVLCSFDGTDLLRCIFIGSSTSLAGESQNTETNPHFCSFVVQKKVVR